MLTLGLSIGANAAILSAVQGVLVAPLPYAGSGSPRAPVRGGADHAALPDGAGGLPRLSRRARTFDGIAAYVRSDLQLGDAQQPEQLRGMQVTAGFFTLLGYRPALGRDFELDDEIQGNTDVVILSHALWMRRFNGDPAVVGRTVRFSGRTFRIVGVLPEGFQHVGGTYRTYGHGEPVDVWSVARGAARGDIPLPLLSLLQRRRARAARRRAGRQWKRTCGGPARASRSDTRRRTARGSRAPCRSRTRSSGPPSRRSWCWRARRSAVLLLACVNVAGLLLGRAAGAVARDRRAGGARRHALASRAAAARSRASCWRSVGGALGVGLAYIAIAALARFGPADMPRLEMIAVNAQVLGLRAGGDALERAAVRARAGAAPGARTASGEALKEGGRAIAGSPQQHSAARAGRGAKWRSRSCSWSRAACCCAASSSMIDAESRLPAAAAR